MNLSKLYALESAATPKTLHTPFWQAAYRSLPESAGRRYLAIVERAERWELGLDAAIESLARVRHALARLFNTSAKPRSAH